MSTNLLRPFFACTFLLALAMDRALAVPDFPRKVRNKVPEVQAELDPGTLRGYRNHTGKSFYFQVTGSATGIVWGTGVYTDDSRLATAAVHAGVLQAGQKAVVKVTLLAGQANYAGTTRNGVASNSYQNWDASYRIEPVDPKVRVKVPQGKTLPDPGDLTAYQGRAGKSFLFRVTGTTTGTVWGTGVYTDDSTLAAAAVHAGVLRNGQKGVVKVTILPGQNAYQGSTQNGVTSAQYGNWTGSFRVAAVKKK